MIREERTDAEMVAAMASESEASVWQLGDGARLALSRFVAEHASLREQLTAAAAENARLEALFHKTHGVHHGWVQRATECDAATARATELERDLAEARERWRDHEAARTMLEHQCSDFIDALAACRRELDAERGVAKAAEWAHKVALQAVEQLRGRAQAFDAISAVIAEFADDAPACMDAIGEIAGRTAAAQHQSAPSEREAPAESGPGVMHHAPGCDCGYSMCAPKPAEATGAELPSGSRWAALGLADPLHPTPAEATASEHDYAPHPRNEGWSVCRRCGMVRNYSKPTACRGAMPKIATRDAASEPPSATPRVDAGVTREDVFAALAELVPGAADKPVHTVMRWMQQTAELERRARELWIARLCYATAAADECGEMTALRQLLESIDRVAELLEAGATKGSSDGKE